MIFKVNFWDASRAEDESSYRQQPRVGLHRMTSLKGKQICGKI